MLLGSDLTATANGVQSPCRPTKDVHLYLPAVVININLVQHLTTKAWTHHHDGHPEVALRSKSAHEG